MNVNKIVLSVVSTAVKCIVLIIMIFFLYHGGKRAYSFGKAVFMDEPMTNEENAREITVTIPEDASAKEIGEILERKNLIRDSWVFWVQTFCVDEGDKMKGGQYDLSTAMSAEEMIERIAASPEEEKNGE